MKKQEKSTYPIKKITVSDAIVIDNEIWFMVDSFNCLMRMDINTRQMTVVGSFPNEPYGQRYLYSSMKQVGNKIYFAPYYAKAIAVYDMKEKCFSSIKLDADKFQRKLGNGSFNSTWKYGECLYFMPSYDKMIVQLNCVNNKVEYLTDWSSELEIDEEKGVFWTQQIMRDNKLFAPICSVNAILEFDCDTGKCLIHRLDIKETGYSGICDDGERLWIYGMATGELYTWKPESDAVENIKVYSGEKKSEWDGLKWLVYNDNKIELYDIFKSYRERECSEQNVEVKNEGHFFVNVSDDYIIDCARETSILTVVDRKTSNIRDICMETDLNIVDIKKMCQENGIITEMQEIVLNEYLTAVLSVV